MKSSKQNILDNYIDELKDDASPYPEEVIHKAMDEYAKEIAIGFDKWKSDEGYIKHPMVKYSYIHPDTNETIYSNTHLYNLYLLYLNTLQP